MTKQAKKVSRKPVMVSYWQTDVLLTLANAGRLIGISRQAIWNACSRGRLRFRRIAGRPVVSRADVLAYAISRSEGGRPPASETS